MGIGSYLSHYGMDRARSEGLYCKLHCTPAGGKLYCKLGFIKTDSMERSVLDEDEQGRQDGRLNADEMEWHPREV